MDISVFDKYYKEYDNWYERNKFAYFSELKAVKKVLPKKGKGLEIGVGTGRFASVLGIEFGVDPSGKVLEIAKKRGVKVKLARGEKLPFRSSYFDYVALIISLCFVKNQKAVLREAKRVLKNKGKIIIGIVDKDSFLGKFYMKKKSIFYKYAQFFSVKEVCCLLKNLGFSRFSYYQTLFDLPSRLTRIEQPLKGFGKGGFVVISAFKKDDLG